MVLVFDMDDTLYEEVTYVDSGFRAVAGQLAPALGRPARTLHAEMRGLLEQHGRGRVFDLLLQRYGLGTKGRVRACVRLYRAHAPSICLHAAALRCLQRFRRHPLYVVTDGHKVAQTAKVQALGLDRMVRRVFVTHRHGLHRAKPSPHCFQIIQRLERVPPGQIVYVGDNPAKDFVGLRPLGFRTVRVLTGAHATVRARPGHDAEVTISSLDELTPALLRRWS